MKQAARRRRDVPYQPCLLPVRWCLASGDYGTNGGTPFTRPASIPSRSDQVLLTTTAYNSSGEAFSTTDPAGMEIRQIEGQSPNAESGFRWPDGLGYCLES